MTDFTPIFSTEQKVVSKRRTIDHLPGYLQSELLQKFFGVTLDQWMQPKAIKQSSGFIGQKSGLFWNTETDFYIQESSKDRADYQLTPICTSVDNVEAINFTNFYQDLVNSIRSQGSLTNNHSRLFSQEYYSFAPPINVDALINFSNYYWLITGPTTNIITDELTAVIDIVGKQSFTTEDGLVLQSGMRIKFTNDSNVEMNGVPFIVEGVGTSIKLIDDTEYEGYGLYDVRPYDITEYDAVDNTIQPHYVTIGRGSIDGNTWSRQNRWFHKSLIQDLDLENYSVLQARRPIIEFNNNIKLMNYGNFGRRDVDFLIDEDGVLDVAGQEVYTVNTIDLFDGARVLFTNDPDPAKNNRIFKVFGINSLGKIGLELDKDGQDLSGAPVEGEKITVRTGGLKSYADYHVSNGQWIYSQQKLTAVQEPLFELFDDQGESLSDQGIYPGSTFMGSKIFSFKLTDGIANDSQLQLPVSFDTFGNIQFNNNLVTDRVFYTLDFETTEVPGYYFFKELGTTQVFSNEWRKSSKPSGQYINDSFVIEQKTTDSGTVEFQREFTLSQTPKTPVTDSNLLVFVRGQALKYDVDYTITGKVLEISLSFVFKDGDVLEVKTFNDVQNDTKINGFYEIPRNLEANPNNTKVSVIAFNDIYQHCQSIIESQPGFSGSTSGSNNFVSTIRDLSRGQFILNHTAPMLKLMTLSGHKDLDLLSSMRKSQHDYIRFRQKFVNVINKFRTGGYSLAVPFSKWVSDALLELNVGKSKDSPYYNSSMASIDSHIPSTPSAMGMLPLYQPVQFYDDTLKTPADVIRGHDGSIIVAYGNEIDDCILELENRIYNYTNIKFRNPDRVREFDVLKFKPGYFRTTEYSRNEWLQISAPAFQRWAADNRVDVSTNQFYDVNNKFTWNYSQVKGPNGQFLPGFWRGIYLYLFDTDRPHTHPWEMLGFSMKPSWFDTYYGSAPYTGNNSVLWNDIEQGIIRSGERAGTHEHLRRPGVSAFIPVDSQGNLLSPYDSGIATTQPDEFAAKASWSFGDVAPAEYTWMTGPGYGFDLSETLFLAKPAQFVELNWETDKLERVHGQLIKSDLRTRKSSNDYTVHNEITSSGLQRVEGISQWVSASARSRGLDVSTKFGDLIRDLDVRLGYKVGGFTRQQSLRLVNDNFGVLPGEDVKIKLFKGASIQEPVYSGVIVTWDGTSYRLGGYDLLGKKFRVLPGIKSSGTTTVTVGSVSIARNKKSKTTPIDVPYNTVFNRREDVYNFFVDYQRYLESQGWLFDEFDETGKEISFESSAKQFLQWSQNVLKTGQTIIFSPVFKSLRFKVSHGHVDNVRSVLNGVYSVLDRSGYGIDRESFEITRSDNEFKITITTNDNLGIYGLRLSLVEFEHILVLDNITKFNDVIYKPEFGVRQPRFRAFIEKTQQWTGRPEAYGYIIREDGLITNFETSVDDISHFLDFDLAATPGGDQTALARHLIGYQSREHLDNLFLDEQTQFDFYRGFIREKGTIKSFKNVLRSDFVTKTADFSVLEEWAFKVGEYGNTNRRSSIQMEIPRGDLRTNPQIIEFTNSTVDDQSDAIISITPEDPRWISRRNNRDIEQFKIQSQKSRKTLPTAGPVLLGETTYIVKDQIELEALYQVLKEKETTITDGHTIWMILGAHGEWDVLRLSSIGKVKSVTAGVAIGDPAKITMMDDHGVDEGDQVIITGSTQSSPDFEGFRTVTAIPTTKIMTFDLSLDTDKTFADGAGPEVFKVQSVRTASRAERDSIVLHSGWNHGDVVFVDRDTNNEWSVYNYQTKIASSLNDPTVINLGTLVINGTSIIIFGTSVENVVAAINTASITGITAEISNGYLTINNNTGSSLTLGGTARESLGFDTNYPLWKLNRAQNPRMDLSEIFNVYLWNKQTNQTQIQLQVFDPVKGYIPSTADREIYYKLDYDPAKYTVGDITKYQIDPDLKWGKDQVGRIWLDLSTLRFLDYEQSTSEYRRNNWGSIAPGTSVDVYEWTESPVEPIEWPSYISSVDEVSGYKPSGTLPLGAETPYVKGVKYNPGRNVLETVYYFWTKSPSYVPLGLPFRTLSAQSIETIIGNPKQQNLPWFVPITQTDFLINGIDSIISHRDSILQINFMEQADDSIVHKQWKLVREKDATTPVNEVLWNKMRDSLVGYDDLGLSVPDVSLYETVRYGNSIRPRQTWFKNITEARRQFVNKVNKILVSRNIIDSTPGWDTSLYQQDPLPVTGFDYKVLSLSERDALDGLLQIGKKVLVENDISQGNKWAVWLYQGPSSWTLLNKQIYKMTDFWSLVDWWATGYDANTFIRYTFDDLSERNSATFANGDTIRVLDNGTGRWAIYEYNAGVFSVIGQEEGTLQLLDYFYDPVSFTEQEVSIVLKNILSALRVDILTVEETNAVFFSSVHYAHTEQQVVDWAFKTSFVYGSGNGDVLEQNYNQVKDQGGNFIKYLEEAKPYHVKIRSLIEEKQTNETANVDIDESHLIDIGVLFDRVSSTSTIPDGANPKDYDWNTLDAASRVQLLYSPTKGMPEKVLSSLISRAEYAGTILDGMNFYQFGTLLGVGYDKSPNDLIGYDYDVTDLEHIYDVFVNGGETLGAEQTFGDSANDAHSIHIDGFRFVQPEIGEDHPEELTKVRAGDAVMIDVYVESPFSQGGLGFGASVYDELGYDLDESDIILPYSGRPTVRIKRFRGPDSGTFTGPFVVGHQPQSKNSLFVYLNGELLKIHDDYEVDWSRVNVVTTNSITPTDELVVVCIGTGGAKVVKRKTFKNTDETVFDMGVTISSPAHVLCLVDGERATITVSGSEVTIVSPTVDESTVFIAIFENDSYSFIETDEFIADSADDVYTASQEPLSSVPAYHTTIVHRNGLRLNPPMMKTYHIVSGERFYKLGDDATAPEDIIVYVDEQEYIQGTDYSVFYVSGFTVTTPGSGYTVGDDVTVTGTTGSGFVGEVAEVNGTGGITRVTINDPGEDYTGTITASVTGSGSSAVIVPMITKDEINLTGTLVDGERLTVILKKDHDYTIDLDNPENVSITGSTVGDAIKITTFSEDVSYGMRTEVFKGNASGFYNLGEIPFDTNSTWVTVNGERMIFNKDYVLANKDSGYDSEYAGYGLLYDSDFGYGVEFDSDIHSPSDSIVVTYFTERPQAEPIAFRIFKNIFGSYDYLRISDQHSTVLTAALTSDSKTIVVEDASVLPQPDRANNQPGVITIDGERIAYWSIDTTTPGLHELRNCMRGTAGTGINPTMPIGARVRDASSNQQIPGGYYWKYTPNGLQHDSEPFVKFLSKSPGTYNI